jgi:hypothetical protein
MEPITLETLARPQAPIQNNRAFALATLGPIATPPSSDKTTASLNTRRDRALGNTVSGWIHQFMAGDPARVLRSRRL